MVTGAAADPAWELPCERFHFPVDPFARQCMLEGVDQLGYLAGLEARIAAYERTRARAY